MSTWIPFSAAEAEMPNALSSVLEVVKRLVPRLDTRVGPDDGLKRSALVEFLAGGSGLTPFVGAGGFAVREIDLEARQSRTGVAVQAGRAYTNNGALISVLAAAAEPRLNQLVLLVPGTYKGSHTGTKVTRQMNDLARAEGIRLNLSGVVLVEY